MTPRCFLCTVEIKPATKAVEILGGLFDPADPTFFVADRSVCDVSYAHLECLVKKLKPNPKKT